MTIEMQIRRMPAGAPLLAMLAGLVVLTGCVTSHRNPRLGDLASGGTASRSESVGAPNGTELATPDPEPQLHTLDLHSRDELRPSLWTQTSTAHLSLAATDGDSGPGTASDSTKTESLFSNAYWNLALQDVKQTFTAPARWETRDWLVFGGVVAGISTVAVFDKDIQQAVQRNRSGTVNSVFNAVEPFGAEYAFGALGVFYLGGEAFKDPRAKSVALDGLSASIIASGLILQPLKYSIGRSRPNQNQGPYYFRAFGGSDSFPSGHATEAFVLATVIAEHYDSLLIKVGAYGLASMVGYARLNNNAHWASDVLAGAALGTLVSHVVVHFNQSHRNVSLQPIIGLDMQGAQLVFSF